MSTLATTLHADPTLSAGILAHLDAQLASARRMLQIVLEQSAAIRRRAVGDVVRLAGALQAEIHRRKVIELERERLLRRSASALGLSETAVTVAALAEAMDEEDAQAARERTAELRTMCERIQWEHATNRALMQQELAFLDHLLRLAGGAGAYDAAGERVSRRKRASLFRQPVFELEV